MANFPTPPTHTLPIEENPTTKKPVFSPLWIQWFIQMADTFTKMGFTVDGGIDHNLLENLQGGDGATQFYHLTEQSHRYLSLQHIDGIILRDTNGIDPHYWRITISPTGVLQTLDLGTTPP